MRTLFTLVFTCAIVIRIIVRGMNLEMFMPILIANTCEAFKQSLTSIVENNALPELEALIGEWIDRYKKWRPHTANSGQTPWQAYRGEEPVLEVDEIQRSETGGFKVSAPPASVADAPEAGGSLTLKKVA